MESLNIDLDNSKFQKALQEDISERNGWEQICEGSIPDYPDCTLKASKKIRDGDSVVTTCSEAVLKNFKAENFFRMMTDISLLENRFKKLEVIENLSKNSDILYVELELPPPLGNRDFVWKRVFLSSEEDFEVLRKLGLADLDHKYYVILQESTERAEYPAGREDVVRGETKLSCWLIEEDPKEKEKIKIKSLLCQDMNVKMPGASFEKMGVTTRFSKMLEGYVRVFGREK